MKEECVESKLEFTTLLALSQLLCYNFSHLLWVYIPLYSCVHVPQVT